MTTLTNWAIVFSYAVLLALTISGCCRVVAPEVPESRPPAEATRGR